MKALFKNWLGHSLPGLLRRFSPAERSRIIRASISDATLLEALTEDEVRQLLVGCARRLRLRGFVSDGEIGPVAGLTGDENVHRQYMAHGDWTPSLRSMFAVWLAGGGTYLDVGANIGLTVIPMARLPGVRCLALEPEPTNYRFLRANAALNGVESAIEFHNVAAMASAGELVMSISAWNSGDHRVEGAVDAGETLSSASAQGKPLVRVKGVPLDELVDPSGLEHPVVCKIDTQGAEVEVLKGAGGLLREVDLLTIEFWPAGLRRLGGDAESLLRLLRAGGFGYGLVTQLDGSGASPIPAFGAADDVFAEASRLAQQSGPDDYWDLILSRRPPAGLEFGGR